MSEQARPRPIGATRSEGAAVADPLIIAGEEVGSRLLLGTGGMASLEALGAALDGVGDGGGHGGRAPGRPERRGVRSSTS